MYSKLKQTLNWVNAAYIAKHHFKKDKSWFYHRVNKNYVNGKPVEFNEVQKKEMAKFFRDKSKELIELANILDNGTSGN